MTSATDASLAARKVARERRNALYEKEPADLTDDELIELLEPAYAPTAIPPCHICGGELAIQSIGGGMPTVWACASAATYPIDWDHYNKSRFEDRRQGGDALVMEACRRLKAGAR